MGGGGINTSATKLEALNIQSSTAGAVIPWLRGQHRIPGNLLWYGDFKATAHTQQQGGKGGGGTSTSYTYSASLAMAVCHGTIASINNVWKGKGTTSAAALGLTVRTGAVGQPIWSGLSGRGTQSLSYSGLAYVAALNYSLGDSASVENHSFEVRHISAGAVDASTPDVDPQVATYDLLTHPHQGAAFPAALIGDWSDWSDYCVANRLLISPLLTTQTTARDALQTMADLTNTGIVWSDGKLKMRPYGDQEVTAYGRTFTPDTTPVYELDDNCYIKQGDEAPVKRSLKSSSDRHNIVKVQYRDRANGYNPAVVEAKDLTDISANGARPLDMIEADWICTGEVARFVAEIRKQRELLVVGEYTFRLPWHYALIECMDLLTLSDSVLMLDGVPVRVKQIVEESDEELAFTCEDFPAGVASAPLYASQGMTGFALNANVAPGDAMAPLVFELPGALTTTGLELAIASGSTDPNWGGCQVWVSYDGTTYRQLAELRGTSRYGITQLDSGGSMNVFTNAGQQLLSGSAADAGSLATLLYVAPAGAIAGEYMAYETATLTAPNAYTLGGLVRGAYGTTQVAHGGATPWVRVDDAIARSGPLDPALIGKTVHIKLTSFNVFGGAPQSLAEVDSFEYTITGKHYVRGRPNATMGIKLNVNDFAGNVNFSEAYIHGRDASGAAIDAPGSIFLNGVPTAVPNGPLNTNFGPVAGYLMWDSAGSTFAALGTQTRPYVMARRYRGQWQYDDNNGSDWVNFTPTATMYVIGTVETGAPDAGNPGSAPGIVAASLWAAAETPNSIVAAADSAYAAAAAAQAAADDAGVDAAAAMARVEAIDSDSVLSRGEKPQARLDWQAISDSYGGILDKADAFGITTERAAFVTAVNVLGAYLTALAPSWSDATSDTPIVAATWRANWATVYTSRQALLNKIAEEAGKRANWGQVANRPSDDSIRNNLVDVGWWKRGAAIPWGQNGEENILYSTEDVGGAGPRGGSDVVWYAHEISGGGDSGGGWDAANTLTLDPGKTYRFVVPIRVRDSGLHGYAYWGVQASTVCDLNGTDTHGNPYFAVGARDAMPTDRWHLFVGYVFPYGSVNNSHAGAGIYDCKTGALIQTGNNWNHSATGATGHRAYQFYAGNGATQVFGRPMVNVVDGTEPSLREYFEAGAVLNTELLPVISAAQAAAEAYALARANAADTAARAYADGIVDVEEARAIADADAKASAAQAAAIAAASSDATSKANAAQSAAQAYALAQANAADVSARAYADGVVDAEEARAIADADAKATAARIAAEAAAAADATAKANVAALTSTWSGVSGSGKPADNATVGGTFGVNISGQAGTGDIASTAITELASASGYVAYSNIG
jgi:hypothetical protein